MIILKELDESLFKIEKFDFIIGEHATYNSYYKIILQYGKSEIIIGLQTFNAGIKPQVVLFEKKILLGFGDKFCIYDLQGKLIKEYSAFPVFYELIIKKNHFLIISELSIFLLDDNFNKIWEKDFDEIIDLVEISESKIILRNYNGTLLNLDFLTGREKCL